MTSSIDPIRRAARLRRAARAKAARNAAAGQEAGLPALQDPARTATPAPEAPPSAAVFDAQLLGQDGQKRGLRAGPLAIGSASASYSRVEWSGSKDRRARKGRFKTEI